jgi:hypothetical protein
MAEAKGFSRSLRGSACTAGELSVATEMPSNEGQEVSVQVTEISARSGVPRPARRGIGGIDPMALAISGMSGRRYRMFINNLIGQLRD